MKTIARALLSFFCLTASLTSESDTALKARMALSLHDVREARSLIEQLQNENALEKQALLFEYLAEIQDFGGMQALFKKGNISLPSTTLEQIAWANIRFAASSYHPKLRAEALIAATQTQDARCLPILNAGLSDNHAGVQQMALQLARMYPDETILHKVMKLISTGTPEVKVTAAALLASQKAKKALPTLNQLLIDDSLSETDQVCIALQIATLSDDVEDSWIEEKTHDTRPSIRALAASLIRRHPSPQRLKLLLPLLSDTSSTVRIYATETLALWLPLIPEDSLECISAWIPFLHNQSIPLEAAAAYALLLSNDSQGKALASIWFTNLLTHTDGEEALIGTSRLIKTGTSGLPLAHSLLFATKNPYARLNIATFLLSHRYHSDEASTVIAASLPKTLLGTNSDGFSEWIGSSKTPHDPSIPRLPESEDLFIRLQLFALRSFADQKIEQKELEQMLDDRAWGISASAAALLFEELPGSLDEILAPLLQHENETVRIQAALLLAIIAPSPQAATALAKEYETASREGKETLLLGFGCLPFSTTKDLLCPLLFDNSPTIRTRASSALLTSMYR